MLSALEQTETVEGRPRRSARELYDRAINFVSLIVILVGMGIVVSGSIIVALHQPGYWVVAMVMIIVSVSVIWAMIDVERRSRSRG